MKKQTLFFCHCWVGKYYYCIIGTKDCFPTRKLQDNISFNTSHCRVQGEGERNYVTVCKIEYKDLVIFFLVLIALMLKPLKKIAISWVNLKPILSTRSDFRSR